MDSDLELALNLSAAKTASEKSDSGSSLADLAAALKDLAAQGIYAGCSSWKYQGWQGQIYEESRYMTRGKFSEARFNRKALSDYARTFPTVCVDAGYYQFPTERSLGKLCTEVPEGFKFAFKVTDAVTVKHFPKLPRFGKHGGTENSHFLDADLFQSAFLEPCSHFRESMGALIFEFSHFYRSDFARGRDFVAALDQFLERLPGGWQYAVEVRNPSFLQPEYFEMLQRHGVAHVFTSWTRMPPIAEQIRLGASQLADFAVARFLLKPGRTYAEAVQQFSPYSELKEINESGRAAARLLLEELKARGKRASYVYVNNRFEGNAPGTLAAILKVAE